MLTQPEFPENPFDLITTERNRTFSTILISNGAEPNKISSILTSFFSHNLMMRDIYERASNIEWINTKSWMNNVARQYDKAIKCLEKLLADDLMPSVTKETIIQRDINKLKDVKNFLARPLMLKPLIKPEPASVNQMIVFQSLALYEYLKQFKGEKKDKDVYDFMAELLRNLYKTTAIDKGMKNLTGGLLKKNYIDNAYKVRGKYDELEKAIKPYVAKPSR